MNTPTKAIVKTQFPQFAGIFDIGDKVEIETIGYEKDTVICREQTRHNRETGRVEITIPALIAPKGSYYGFRIKSKNGNYYDDQCFLNAIGYKPLSAIFKKL